MNDEVAFLILMTLCALMLEIGGLWLIKWSPRYPNPSYVKKAGKFTCIMGIVALVSGLLGYWMMVT
jgi:hypothetical protein